MADEAARNEHPDNMNTLNQNFICGAVEGFYGRPWTTEQRKDLFTKMKKLGLNTYMYAPKDDFKHRAYWRELYTVEEAEHLTNLIVAAKENSITFYYALSPGLDICYSSAKEVGCLKRKLEQVSEFGCTAFALLFDDIEPEISETDKEVFQSFAHAQVSVTNEVYQYLSQPKFIVCPTEYCAARAVPNVQNSDYLSTLGSKLLPGIDIMWTGSKVISKVITVQSIQELTEVLRRRPVIWDNLHANDYDQKRLFLGPYSGRSTELIPHLRGVLTNPNCEYETNFIPIHTLAQWRRCNADGKRELNINDTVTSDIKLETESENGSVEDIPSHLGPNTYHPKKAVNTAISEWLQEFYKAKTAYGQIVGAPFMPTPIPAVPNPVVNTCMSVTMTTGTSTPLPIANANEVGILGSSDSSFQPFTSELANSLVVPSITPLVKEEGVTEPMDCNPSPESSPKHGEAPACQPEVSPVENGVDPKEGGSNLPEKLRDMDGAEAMQTEQMDGTSASKQLLYEDISLLVDMFYLPFEHGCMGLQFLQDFYWLKTNSHAATENRHKKPNEPEPSEAAEWYKRAEKFDRMTQNVGHLLTKLTFCPNRSLLYDIYPYIWDIKGVISLLNSYIKWLALGRVPTPVVNYMSPAFTWFSRGYKEAFVSGDQEPWLFRGGLTAELQRLLPLESMSDLFLYKPPESPNSKIYTIRPYLGSDESSINEVCRRTCDDGLDGSKAFPGHPNLIGDKLVGAYLCLSSDYCFVVEDENGVCGYGLAALDAQQFHKKIEVAWTPELCSKYPEPKKEEDTNLTPAEEIICGFHASKASIPELVYKHHPSLVRINVLPNIIDASVPKRLLACVLSALKANGSTGVFCEVPVGDKNVTDFYTRMGFLEIAVPVVPGEDVGLVYLGRTF